MQLDVILQSASKCFLDNFKVWSVFERWTTIYVFSAHNFLYQFQIFKIPYPFFLIDRHYNYQSLLYIFETFV